MLPWRSIAVHKMTYRHICSCIRVSRKTWWCWWATWCSGSSVYLLSLEGHCAVWLKRPCMISAQRASGRKMMCIKQLWLYASIRSVWAIRSNGWRNMYITSSCLPNRKKRVTIRKKSKSWSESGKGVNGSCWSTHLFCWKSY